MFGWKFYVLGFITDYIIRLMLDSISDIYIVLRPREKNKNHSFLFSLEIRLYLNGNLKNFE